MHSALNLTGVGWNAASPSFQFCMVSPVHFVGANHVTLNIGATLQFLNTSGSLKTRLNSSLTPITNDEGEESDLNIGKINTPFSSSDGIEFHPYLNLSSEFAYWNKSVIILGKEARGATQNIFRVIDAPSSTLNTTRVIRMRYNLISGDDDDARFQGGDSGSPVFYNQNGIAAIVGTNSLTSLTGDNNYSNFIPHYIDKLNAVMEVDGYRMTKAIPGSTTLTLNHQLPATPIRAGHAFSIDLTLNNTGSTLAENVKLTNTFPIGTVVSDVTGTDWFDESITGTTQARKAILNSSGSTSYNITLSLLTPGNAQHQISYACDQFSAATETFNFDVIESFVSWSASLTDTTTEGDDDNDGISNLLEYAFGGDPTISAQNHPNTTTALLPHYGGNQISYIQRTDSNTRALAYQLTTSTTLNDVNWANADSLVTHTVTNPIDTNFELVTLTLNPSDTERFFRIEVTISE